MGRDFGQHYRHIMRTQWTQQFFAVYNASSMGLVARDSTSHLVEARTKCNIDMILVNMAEAMVVKEELSWIKVRDVLRLWWRQIVYCSSSNSKQSSASITS